MKTQCSRCGKQFVYQKHDGICPYCGRYNSLYHSKETKEHGTDEKPNFQKQPATDRDPEQDEAGSKKNGLRNVLIKDKPQTFFCFILLLAMAITPVYMHLEEKREEKALLEQWNITELPEETLLFGKTFSFMGDNIMIEQETASSLYAPEGFYYLCFPFTTEHGDVLGWDWDIFLKADDIFLLPYDTFDLTEDEDILNRSFELDLPMIPTGYHAGLLIVFLVPDSASDLELLLYENEDIKGNIRKVTRLFKTPVCTER